MKVKFGWIIVSGLMVTALMLSSCASTPATKTTTATSTTPATTIVTQTQTTAPTTVKTTIPTPTTTAASANTPQYGGILRIGTNNAATFLGNPAAERETFAELQAAPAIESLLRVDKSGQVIPWLAKSWVEDPVAMTITLTLNTGIMFQDGTPFNAAAVKWNLDADVAANQAGTTLIKSVDAVNDSTVRINLKQWDNTLLPYLGYSYPGMMISPTAFQKNGGTLWADNNPVGTGPFIFEDWINSVSIAYSKNPNYWQSGEPYVNRIEFVIIADQTVDLLNFKAGKTDLFQDPLASDLPTLVKTYPSTVIAPFSIICTPRDAAIFDSANPKSPFADVRVRQAVQYAVDPNAMNQAILNGLGDVTNQFATTDSWGYDPTIVGYPYNPDKAKQLLSDAGYAPGQLKTNYYYLNQAPQDAMAAALKGYLQAVGINLTLVPLTMQSRIAYLVKWDGLVTVVSTESADPVASLESRYIGVDPRYFGQMLVPSDYKQAVLNAVSAPDFATEKKDIQTADELFTDKYCLAVTWCIHPQSCAKQSWVHNDGYYGVASSALWTPEAAWKDSGH